jgi:uncharacterized membrane protein YjgN (DUF898 family)
VNNLFLVVFILGIIMKDQVTEPVPEPMKAEPMFKRFMISSAEKGAIFRIFFVNLFFTIITLGIYRFWAKTRMRRYILSHIEILGDRLEYTGTGGELFKGFLIVFFVFFLPFGILPNLYAQHITPTEPETAGLIGTAQFILFFSLFPVAIYRAMKYLASRMNWRGIPFALSGKTFGYWWRWLAFSLAVPFTLGLLYPVMEASLTRYMTSNMRFGSLKFSCDLKGRQLYGAFLLMVLFAVVGFTVFSLFATQIYGDAMGIIIDGASERHSAGDIVGAFVVMVVMALAYIFFLSAISTVYMVKYWNKVAETTKLEGCSFQANLTFEKLFKFRMINAAILIFTLGLAYPLVIFRHIAFVTENLKADDIASLERSIHIERDRLTSGEGLADGLDVGAF